MTVVTQAVPTSDAVEHERLSRAWKRPEGLFAFLMPADHKVIGLRFIVTALVFFTLAGLLSLVMRAQLAVPSNDIVGPDLYNQIFTMHGTTMMFLFAVPIMQGMAIWLVPLMVGTRNIAFPRMNAFAYWTYLFGGLTLWVGFALDIGPDIGWFAYPPLSGPEFGIGKRPDIWSMLVNFTELSGILVATQLIVTILKMRAPGMSLSRMPLYVWTILVQSFMVIFALPAVMTASLFLTLDRLVGTHFYNPAEGGDPILWQHLFWFFAHPEVYLIFLPATGFVSAILPAFTRRKVFGYLPVVLSAIATGFIGFGVWVHHMFATGLPQLGQSFFTAASLMIVIPTGVQIFCWIATIRLGTPRLEPPMLFVLGFVATFVMGGLTGVMLASVPINIQVHDTFFVVAHLHYVLIGGAVFPLFGAFYFWFPKLAGRMLNRTAGMVNFVLLFAGFHLTFFPMHQLGFQGMPRRVYTYLAETGWGPLNMLATVGAFTLGLAVLVFVGNVAVSLRKGRPAGSDPWAADTLEWTTASPVPVYNFLRIPVVDSRDPAWTMDARTPVVVGLSSEKREILVTDVLDARPDYREKFPGPSPWPFITALMVAGVFVGSIFNAWSAVIGGTLASIAATFWLWPRKGEREPLPVPGADDRDATLPAGEP